MFGFLLFVKSFHWLAGDRIEWVGDSPRSIAGWRFQHRSQMDQRPYPGPSLIFHVRMSILFVILWITDFLMFLLAVDSTLTNGVGGMILFASEVSENITNIVVPSPDD
jgi:E3 ubiquitin-protein ligase synoviolin